MLLWVHNLSEFNTLEGVEIIENCISCNSDSSDLIFNLIVWNCQTNKCKNACLKKVKINVVLII